MDTEQLRDALSPQGQAELKRQAMAEADRDGVEIEFRVKIRVGTEAWKLAYRITDDELLGDVNSYFTDVSVAERIRASFPADELSATVDVKWQGTTRGCAST